MTPDELVLSDNWSDINAFYDQTDVDVDRLTAYRRERLLSEMSDADVALCIFVSPVSLRYSINFSNYALFMAHIPSTYLFFPCQGEYALYNAFAPDDNHMREGVPISYMYGGDNLADFAAQFARQVKTFLSEIGAEGGKVALEYVNPSIVQAFERLGLEVVDGVQIIERARLIKSSDEIVCIKKAVAVAELGARMIQQALKPGVTENQLWALLNYTNQANSGGWHDGRMLVSGPRTNPWLQEASDRKVKAGELVGFDTDMIGPMGYCADLSRTLFCGPGAPSARQRELYQLAMAEVEHNLSLVKAGVSFHEFQQWAFEVPEAFQAGAYPCVLHGIGMCDEYPHINPRFRGALPYDGQLESGMVVCIESYMGASGEPDGVKLEQQVLVTETGYEPITTFPYSEVLAG